MNQPFLHEKVIQIQPVYKESGNLMEKRLKRIRLGKNYVNFSKELRPVKNAYVVYGILHFSWLLKCSEQYTVAEIERNI